MHTNSKPKIPSRQLPICVGSKIVGCVRGTVFEKRVSAAQHFLRKPPAIAFDVSTLTDATNAGAEWIAVTDTDSGKTYRAEISAVWANGFRVARGFGEQRALALSRWRIDGAPEPTPTPRAENEPQFSQASLL